MKISIKEIFFLICLTTSTNLFGQSNPNVDIDQPDSVHEWHEPGVHHIEFYFSDDDNDSNPNPGNRNGKNTDSPSGDKESQDGGGSDSEITEGDQKTDDSFDETIENSTESTVGGSDNSSSNDDNIFSSITHENHIAGDEKSNSNQYNRPSRNYDELIQKGRKARDIIIIKSKNVAKAKSFEFQNYIDAAESADIEGINAVYDHDQNLVQQSEIIKLSTVIFDFSLANVSKTFVPFQEQIDQKEYDYQQYRKNLAEQELNKLFPNVRQKNINDLIHARETISHWKTAQKIINDALFNDLYIDATQAISDLQSNVNNTYIGPAESQLFQYIQSLESKSEYRLSQYISDFLKTIDKSLGNQKPISVDQSIKLLNEASSILIQNGDYITVAEKIAEAQILIEQLDGIEESFGPEDIYGSIFLAGFLVKGIAKYGSHEVLKNIVTTGERAAFRKMLSNSAGNGITVLGSFPRYIKVGEEVGANVFNIPSSIWNKMTAAERWSANVKFLDGTIMRGDKIILSDRVTDINKITGSFRKELDYMLNKGYRLSNDGTELIK